MTKHYEVSLEISGPTAMWTRPDTGDAPVSYPAPTYSAVKGIFESILWIQAVEIVPVTVEICSPIVFHTYVTNYGGPLRKSRIMKTGSSYQLLATVLVNVCYRLHAEVQSITSADRRLSDESLGSQDVKSRTCVSRNIREAGCEWAMPLNSLSRLERICA